MDLTPVSTKLIIRAVKIHEDGSREDLGVLLDQASEETKEEEWPEQ